MIHIISISNAHEYDGRDVTEYQFKVIVEALEYSRYLHTIKYTRDGNEFTMFVK